MVSSVLILCLLSSLSSVLSDTSVYDIEADLDHICGVEDESERDDALIGLVYSYLEDGAVYEGKIDELKFEEGTGQVITEECDRRRSLQRGKSTRLRFKTKAKCGGKCPEKIFLVDDSVVIRSTRVLTPSLTDKATTDATTTNTAGAGGRRELRHVQWARGTGNGKYKYQNGGYMNYYNNNRNYYSSNYYHSTDYYYNSNYYNSNYYNNNNNNSNHYHNNYYNKNYNYRGGKGSKSGHNHQQSGGYYYDTDYYNHHHHNHHHHETNSDPDRCECFLPSNRDLQSCAPRPPFTGKGKGSKSRPVIVVPEYVGETSLAKLLNCEGFERITNALIVEQDKFTPCGKGQCGKGSKGNNGSKGYYESKETKGSKGYDGNTANGGYYTSKGSKGSGEYYGSKGSKGYYESKVSKDHKTKTDKGKSSKMKGAKY